MPGGGNHFLCEVVQAHSWPFSSTLVLKSAPLLSFFFFFPLVLETGAEAGPDYLLGQTLEPTTSGDRGGGVAMTMADVLGEHAISRQPRDHLRRLRKICR